MSHKYLRATCRCKIPQVEWPIESNQGLHQTMEYLSVYFLLIM